MRLFAGALIFMTACGEQIEVAQGITEIGVTQGLLEDRT